MLEFALFWAWMAQPQVVARPGPESGEPVRIAQADALRPVSQSPQPSDGVPSAPAPVQIWTMGQQTAQPPGGRCSVPLTNVLTRRDVQARIRLVPPPGSTDRMPVIVPAPSCPEEETPQVTQTPGRAPRWFVRPRSRP